VNQTNADQVRVNRRAVVNTVMNLQTTQLIFLISSATNESLVHGERELQCLLRLICLAF
jgi:hypothetical protein